MSAIALSFSSVAISSSRSSSLPASARALVKVPSGESRPAPPRGPPSSPRAPHGRAPRHGRRAVGLGPGALAAQHGLVPLPGHLLLEFARLRPNPTPKEGAASPSAAPAKSSAGASSVGGTSPGHLLSRRRRRRRLSCSCFFCFFCSRLAKIPAPVTAAAADASSAALACAASSGLLAHDAALPRLEAQGLLKASCSSREALWISDSASCCSMVSEKAEDASVAVWRSCVTSLPTSLARR